MRRTRHPNVVAGAIASIILAAIANGESSSTMPAGMGLRTATSQAPGAACFSPGTPPEVIDAFEQIMLDELGPRYDLAVRWPGTIGTPIGLSWSLVPDGLSIPPLLSGEPAGNSELFDRMDALFATSGGRAVWIANIEQAFDRWSQLTGVGLYRVTSGSNDWDDGAAWGSQGQPGARGDIRVSMKVIDGAQNILAYNRYPSAGGDMVLDRDEAWASGSPDFLFLRNTVMHEIGHGLGLFHICPGDNTKLMEPVLNLGFDGPQHDDLRGAHHLYGDRTEENDSVSEVIDLGTLTVGTPIEVGEVPLPTIINGSRVSIDANGDQDYFRFTIASSAAVSVTIAPVGLTYDSSEQACSGQPSSCCSGNFVDSLSEANLNVQMIGSDGASVLATAAGQPAGSVESIQNASLPAAGNYYVRVYAENSPSQTQLYTLSLSSGSPCAPPSRPTGVLASGPPDGVWYCDRILVTWDQVPDATSYQIWRSTVPNSGTAQQVGTTGNTGFWDYDVSVGNTYYFWVEASNVCGCSGLAGGDSGAIDTPPAAPTGVAATSTFCDRVVVSWSPVAEATGYRLYRNTANDCMSAQLIHSPPASPWSDFTVTPGVAYFYWVRTEATCGTSGCSTPAASGQAGGMPVPTGVSVVDGITCGANLQITWNAVPGASHYDVYASNVNDPNTAALAAQPTSPSASISANTGAWTWVWVKACNAFAQCCSPFSIGDRGFCGNPPVPENVAASDGAYCDRVRVTWSNIPSTLAISYDVLRDAQVIATGLGSSPYDDFGALPGTSHSYSVRAGNSCNPISERPWSSPDTGYRTLLITTQPSGATVCLGQNYQFCVSAVGPDLGYQWQFNGSNISGAISPCYWATIDGEYRCVVSSPCGSVTTDFATLTVVGFDAADVNGDGSTNGRDIQAFTTVLLSPQGGPPDEQRCAADMDGNGIVDSGDLALFVAALLAS